MAAEVFTAEVWTWSGLVTYYALFFLRLRTREVHIAGLTPHPDQPWMTQVARHVTMADWGFLQPGQYLIHDRDGKFCPAFQHVIDAAGVQRVPLPPRSPMSLLSVASEPPCRCRTARRRAARSSCRWRRR